MYSIRASPSAPGVADPPPQGYALRWFDLGPVFACGELSTLHASSAGAHKAEPQRVFDACPVLRAKDPPAQGYAKGVHAVGQSLEVPTKNNASYSYDHVCDEEQSQAEIFDSVGAPVTDAFLQGYHGRAGAHCVTCCLPRHHRTGRVCPRVMSAMASHHAASSGGGDQRTVWIEF